MNMWGELTGKNHEKIHEENLHVNKVNIFVEL